MKKVLIVLALVLAFVINADAQCAICTRTAAQLGEKPSRGMNAGILYLAFTPLAIIGFVAWRWLKGKDEAQDGAAEA